MGGSVCGGEVCVWRVLGGLVGGRGEGICGGGKPEIICENKCQKNVPNI